MWKNPIFQEKKKCQKPYFSGEKKKCQKNPIFQERKKMWKNPIFQERKKNVKKPYFSGEKKKCEKTLFFRREMWKNVKKPYFSGGEKKKNICAFQKFSLLKYSVFWFCTQKIFGRKILSVWKNLMYKKKSFFERVFANFLALFFPKKKKKFFFFGAPKFLKSLRRTYQVIKESPLRRLFFISLKTKYLSCFQKTNFSRALTKRRTAILRPFLESSRCQIKKFSLEP